MKKDVVTFLYHEVSDDPNSTGFIRKSNLPYKHKSNEFIDNIEAIKNAQIEPITIKNINDETDKHKILLTFDDGGKSAMHIADILDKYKWKAHFLVTTSMIGNKTFLNKSDIQELFNRGHIIGSHSHTHPTPFYNLSLTDMKKEWIKSIDVLEQILGSRINCASIPGGDMNKKAIKSISECDIKYLFTSEPTNKTWIENEVVLFGRVCPKAGTKISKVKNFANNKGFIQELIKRKTKNLIKLFLGPLYSIYLKNYHST